MPPAAPNRQGLVPFIEITRPLKRKASVSDSAPSSLSRGPLTRIKKGRFTDSTTGQSRDASLSRDAPDLPPDSISNTRSPAVSESVGPSERYDIYDFGQDEVEENGNLVVFREDSFSGDEDDDGETVPVRLLKEFTLYRLSDGELIPAERLLMVLDNLDNLTLDLGASGLVYAWKEDESDEESGEESDDEESASESESQRVKLGQILELNVHHVEDGAIGNDAVKILDGKIYIRTNYAWYILGQPSSQYRTFYQSLWMQHQLLHLVTSTASEQSYLTLKEFEELLGEVEEDEVGVTPESILGRQLAVDDLQSPQVLAYIKSVLPTLVGTLAISRVPLVRTLLERSINYHEDSFVPLPLLQKSWSKKSTSQCKTAQSGTPSSSVGPSQSAPASIKRKGDDGQTYLLSRVNQVAQHFFNVALEVAKSASPSDREEDVVQKFKKHRIHEGDPTRMKWGKQLGNMKGYYSSVVVDGVEYKIGDVVMVAPDPEEKAKEPSQSRTVNQHGEHWWFCQIRYFYQEKHFFKFHALWFLHGSRTILQETAHSNSLYLLQQCADLEVETIYQKANFSILKPSDPEQEDTSDPDLNHFYCGLLYLDEETDFLDLPLGALDVIPGVVSCYSCSLEKNDKDSCWIEKETLFYYGTEYHKFDFVYLSPSQSTEVLQIAQIDSFSGNTKDDIMLSVSYFGRWDDFVEKQYQREGEKNYKSDERKLFCIPIKKAVPVTKLDGLCYVKHLVDQDNIQMWIDHDDHFYFNQSGSVSGLKTTGSSAVQYCKKCYSKDKDKRKQKSSFFAHGGKLVGMELFCGAGGLGIGMELSQFVDIKYAVEYSPSAAKTYKTNHPHTKVFCDDTNVLLKNVYEKTADIKADKMLPDKSAHVDFIFGGPPCQSFSMINHSKYENDIRSSLPCNMLSYVEYYEPDYFLLENVYGIINHKMTDKRKEDGGQMKLAMVKLIMRTLIALGYQVRFQLLQAGKYGVPQSRRRVIFWGAKRGLHLPEFPLPMYTFPAKDIRIGLPTDKEKPYMTRPGGGSAPLKGLTINDATSDLPPFDWSNPHLVIPATKGDEIETRARTAEGILQTDGSARGGLAGYVEGAHYLCDPQNRYQQWLRRELHPEDTVTAHVTKTYNVKTVEVVCNVPIRPLADHKDVPRVLLTDKVKNPKNPKNSFYGRLDGNSFFKCALTELHPRSKNSWAVHPMQKRVISIRECARAQGFPDSYVFESVHDDERKWAQDAIRQIGNAVAIPFALALGKKLGEALILNWEEKRREDSVEL